MGACESVGKWPGVSERVSDELQIPTQWGYEC